MDLTKAPNSRFHMQLRFFELVASKLIHHNHGSTLDRTVGGEFRAPSTLQRMPPHILICWKCCSMHASQHFVDCATLDVLLNAPGWGVPDPVAHANAHISAGITCSSIFNVPASRIHESGRWQPRSSPLLFHSEAAEAQVLAGVGVGAAMWRKPFLASPWTHSASAAN
jgi:hypothetical protein